MADYELKAIRCKNCGADLAQLAKESTDGTVRCPYCHLTWTIARKDILPEAKLSLSMGEHDLDCCRFDSALQAFKRAAELAPNEPEAYFGMARAKFKIQDLKDFQNQRIQPICHEITDKNFLLDADYLRALSLATEEQRSHYERRGRDIRDIAEEFARLQIQGVDYDCFICVKVSEDGGAGHTRDYETANDIYFHLKDNGCKPFFSERVLHNLTGSAYEAHILYALYKSECMLVVCSNDDYLQTPWVKNEYTRFNSMIAGDDKESDSITIVFNRKPIERLPGREKKIQGVDISKPDAYGRIEQFVYNHTPEAKKRKEQAAKRKAEAEQKARLEQEEQQRKIEEQQQKLADQQRWFEEQQRRFEEQQRQYAEQQRRLEEQQRQYEEQQRRLEEQKQSAPTSPTGIGITAKQMLEEMRKIEEEEKRAKEEAARKAEEERKRKEEEARRKAEEERRLKEMLARQAEEERKRKEEEARKAEEVLKAEGKKEMDSLLVCGHWITFGHYPQSKVTDNNLISELNRLAGTKPSANNSAGWTDYRYYISDGMQSFMWYKDVSYGGEKYRAVYFDKWRPRRTDCSSSEDDTYQGKNGYKLKTVYWFKWEPIQWKILQKSDGELTLFSDMLLDSQHYYRSTSKKINGRMIDRNNYAHSDIREWLNNNFYNSAFDEQEKNFIKTTLVDNSAATTQGNTYSCENTSDKIYLLSYKEATNASYGFNSADDRKRKPTDYAQAQGAYTNTDNGNTCWWWLRSPNHNHFNEYALTVSYTGDVDYSYVPYSSFGVAPAFRIKDPNSINMSLTEIYNALDSLRKTEEFRKAEVARRIKEEKERKAEEARRAEAARKAEEERKRKEEEERKAEEERQRRAKEAVEAEEAKRAANPYTIIDGKYVTFGYYPQSRVTDKSLLKVFDRAAGGTPAVSSDWKSYEYYIEGEMKSFMWYKDVRYRSDRYRAVYFDDWRPFDVMVDAKEEDTFQSKNGYQLRTIYWFKWEPIKWRILSNSGGELTLLSDMVLDSQHYFRTISKTEAKQPNKYDRSDIRSWLNGMFYNAAFTAQEKNLIKTTLVDNRATTTKSIINRYACENTSDKIYLLSYKDAKERGYGFNADDDRKLKPTDYAQAQGAYVDSDDGHCCWWLRSPDRGDEMGALCVSGAGEAGIYTFVTRAAHGVAPALTLSTKS